MTKLSIKDSLFLIHIYKSLMLIDTQTNSYLLYPQKGVYYIHPELLRELKKKNSTVSYYRKKLEMLELNGFLRSRNIKLNANFKAETLIEAFSNTLCIDFEVTDRCNLNCYYCAYGKFYNNESIRGDSDIDIKKAIIFLNYVVDYLNSQYNTLVNKPIYIGFYGGEPLMNFEVIKEITNYSKNIKLKNGNYFKYLMTTNGILLDKYKDFLAENDFRLTVSLDGNKEHNSYRKFQNEADSYNIVYNNVNSLRRDHPSYFENSVFFHSVLHDKNDIDGILNFFYKEFSKRPIISYMSETGLNEDYLDEFNEHFYQESNSSPEINECNRFLRNYGNIIHNDYYELFVISDYSYFLPTGTCMPFSRRCYLTVNSKILPCERISEKHAMGFVDNKKVHLDFENIADRINTYYSEIFKQCKQCINIFNCTQCIFRLPFYKDSPICRESESNRENIEKMNRILTELERDTSKIKQILEK